MSTSEKLIQTLLEMCEFVVNIVISFIAYAFCATLFILVAKLFELMGCPKTAIVGVKCIWLIAIVILFIIEGALHILIALTKIIRIWFDDDGKEDNERKLNGSKWFSWLSLGERRQRIARKIYERAAKRIPSPQGA